MHNCYWQEPWQSYCVEPPCGQLNLANPNMYLVLAQIYEEMAKLFTPLDLFHYGGDEVGKQRGNASNVIQSVIYILELILHYFIIFRSVFRV